MKKIDKRSSDDCWEWLAYKNRSGYGEFWYIDGYTLAHRFSYALFYGNIPTQSLVLHKCNNRGCVNPYHLYLGDHADNALDMIKAGNSHEPRGFSLNSLKRDSIKKLLVKGLSQREIANIFGVSQWMIWSINRGINHAE